jgi:hypothetical protein
MTGRTFELFRFTHPDGSAKEWAYAETGGGLYEVRWGRAGHLVNAQARVALRTVRQREQQKLRKGYRHVGRALIFSDGDVKPLPSGQDRTSPPACETGADTAPHPKTPIDIAALLGGDDAGFYF